MDRQSVVSKFTLTHAGTDYEISYFVENGFAHAVIDGRPVRVPLVGQDAEAMLRALFLARMSGKNQRMSIFRRWRQETEQ